MPRTVGSTDIDGNVRKLVLDAIENGMSMRQAAAVFQISPSTVSRWKSAYEVDGDIGISSKRKGRQQDVISKLATARLLSASQNDPFATASTLKGNLDLDFSVSHIRRLLKKNGLGGYVAVKKERLTEAQQLQRYMFSQDHLHFTQQDWDSMANTDEKTFVVGDDGRVYVRRPEGERYNPDFIADKIESGRSSVNTWGMISPTGGLALVRCGRLDAEKYLSILRDIAIPKLFEVYGTNFIFQQDKCPIHNANIVKDYFNNTGLDELPTVRVLDWPAKGGDMSPIENVWGILARKVGQRKVPNANKLWDAVYEEWNKLSENKDLFRALFDSIPVRVKMVNNNGGAWTSY